MALDAQAAHAATEAGRDEVRREAGVRLDLDHRRCGQGELVDIEIADR